MTAGPQPTSGTSSTAQTFTFEVDYLPKSRRERIVRWYMGRIAGRYCPCEWPVKFAFLIHLCGRIDDAYDRYEFRRFAAFHMESRRLRQTVARQRTEEET